MLNELPEDSGDTQKDYDEWCAACEAHSRGIPRPRAWRFDKYGATIYDPVTRDEYLAKGWKIVEVLYSAG